LLGHYWACLGELYGKKAQRYWSDLAWARLGLFGRDPLELLAWASWANSGECWCVPTFPFSFEHSPFALSFPLFPIILKLTQIWE